MVIDIGRGSASGSSSGGLREVKPKSQSVVETADEGFETETIRPGETREFLVSEFPDEKYKLLAIGANDVGDVSYTLELGGPEGATITTQSPLGTINNPMSFPDKFGSMAVVEDYIRYSASYDSEATGDVEVAGRMYLEKQV